MINEWHGEISSVADGTQPAAAWGTSVTPTAGAGYGSYAQLISGASVTHDCFEIEIIISSVNVSASSRECVVTIGFDPAGGTSYTDTIQHLICGPASAYYDSSEFPSGGVSYKFPLYVKAGTSIGAKAAASANATAIRVACIVRGRPSRPELIWYGSYVDSIATSLGAALFGDAVTPGTASEGSWTAIGSTLARPIRHVSVGFGIDDSTLNAALCHVDVGIGDSSNKRVVLRNHRVYTNTNESMTWRGTNGAYADCAVGDQLYVRMQSTSALATVHAALYGVG
jgi:hypothetical protein